MNSHGKVSEASALFIANEIFLSGTAAQITPVLSIENHALPTTRPITDQLWETLQKIMVGKEKNYDKWITRVKV